MGTIGDAYDHAVIESFWGRMQTELLDRQWWTTRVELANAILEYLESFQNRQRRHSALGWRTPGRIREAPRSRCRLTRIYHGQPVGPRSGRSPGSL
jgi:transposase InsO family protein